MTIDLQVLNDTICQIPVPAPDTAANFRYMAIKGECWKLLYAEKYSHSRAKTLLASMIGAFGRPVWRWTGKSVWHEGLPPGFNETMGPYKGIRIAVLPHAVELPVLEPMPPAPSPWPAAEPMPELTR